MDYLLALGAYLVGAVPFGLLITRWWKGIDVREHGSGNIGFTNVLRVAGAGPGFLVLLLDIGKGALPVWLASRFGQHEILPAVCALLAVLGHDFPLYLKFRGGKGVATTIGAFLLLQPWATLIALLIWVTSVAITRYVSIGSLLFVINLPLATLVFGAFGIRPSAFHATWIAGCLLAALTIWRHKSNIQRLLAGTENRLGERSAT